MFSNKVKSETELLRFLRLQTTNETIKSSDIEALNKQEQWNLIPLISPPTSSQNRGVAFIDALQNSKFNIH